MNLNKYGPCDLMALLKAANDKLKDPNTIDRQHYQTIIQKIQQRVDYLLGEIDKPKKVTEVDLSKDFIDNLIGVYNTATGNKIRTLPDKAKRQVLKILKLGYDLGNIFTALKSAKENMKNPEYLTIEFITREVEFHKYLNMKTSSDKKVLSL